MRLGYNANGIGLGTGRQPIVDRSVTVLPRQPLVETSDRDADLLENVAMIDALIDPIVRAHLTSGFYVLDFEFDR